MARNGDEEMKGESGLDLPSHKYTVCGEKVEEYIKSCMFCLVGSLVMSTEG